MVVLHSEVTHYVLQTIMMGPKVHKTGGQVQAQVVVEQLEVEVNPEKRCQRCRGKYWGISEEKPLLKMCEFGASKGEMREFGASKGEMREFGASKGEIH